MTIAKLVSKATVAPKFTHDCCKCKFLGRLNGEDLYVCESGEFSRRFSSKDQDSGSLGTFAPPGTPYAFAKALSLRELPPRAYIVG